MDIIVAWPYELNISNRAHYPRVKALSEYYDLHLVTMNPEKIDDTLRKNMKDVTATPLRGLPAYLLYPFTIMYVLFKLLIRGKKTILYVFYNSTILPVMVMSVISGTKVFVDFLDDPYLSPEIMRMEKRKSLKYYIYLIINRLFFHYVTKLNNAVGFCGIGLSGDSLLPRLYVERYSIRPDRMISVPNGADLSFTRPQGGNGRENPRPLRIIYVGIVAPRRETDVLIANLTRVQEPEIELILIGETLTEHDTRWINDVTAEHKWISYKGPLPHHEVLEWIEKSDVGIFTASKAVTNYRYTHPIKVFEYLAMGKPVIAPRYEGIMEIIRDGYNGILFDPDHPEEIADIITGKAASFISGELSQNALKSVRKFDWNTINKKFITDFKKILSQEFLLKGRKHEPAI